MPTVITDWMGGQQPTVREDESGLFASRSFLVKDLGGAANTRIYRAMTATGVPSIGDGHPATGTLLCNGRQPRPVSRDPDAIEVVVDYFRPAASGFDPENLSTSDPVYIRVVSQLEQFGDVVSATGAAVTRRQVERPVVVYEVERTISATGDGTIEDLNATYANKVNSALSKFDGDSATGWPVHSVRCDGIEPVGEYVPGDSLVRAVGRFSVSAKWDVTGWGWRFPEGTTSYTYDPMYETANLISSGFMVS